MAQRGKNNRRDPRQFDLAAMNYIIGVELDGPAHTCNAVFKYPVQIQDVTKLDFTLQGGADPLSGAVMLDDYRLQLNWDPAELSHEIYITFQSAAGLFSQKPILAMPDARLYMYEV